MTKSNSLMHANEEFMHIINNLGVFQERLFNVINSTLFPLWIF